MNPGIAGLIAAAVTGAYVPALRGQLRDGRIDVPFGTINPISIRRNQHPLAFRLAACGLVAMMVTVVAASLALIVRSLLP